MVELLQEDASPNGVNGPGRSASSFRTASGSSGSGIARATAIPPPSFLAITENSVEWQIIGSANVGFISPTK